MKRITWLLPAVLALSISVISPSCKNKSKETTTQQDKTTNDPPVVINSDDQLRSSVSSVVSGYNGVQAEVKDGVVTLNGSIKQEDLQNLISKIQELKPKKVENKLVITIK